MTYVSQIMHDHASELFLSEYEMFKLTFNLLQDVKMHTVFKTN